jgi:fatty-acyl-CoA synthase
MNMDSGFDPAKIKLDTTQVDRWSFLTVPYLVERGGLDPHKPALVFEETQRTYGELRERARRVANALIDRGIEPMDRVAVLSRNCVEFIEIEVGIAGARAIMVPLNWRLQKDELRNLLQRSEARAIIVEGEYAPVIASLREAGDLPQLDFAVVLGEGQRELGYEELCASASSDRPPREGRLEDPHEIIYTSGTTGQPKGAVWSNGTVLWNSIQQVMDYRLGPEDSTYAAIDLYYIGGRHDFTWPVLHQGGTVHIKRSGGWDAREIAEYVATNRITHVLWVPTMLFDILRLEGLGELDFSALRAIMSGGAPISAAVTAQAQEAFPDTDFLQVFGLTEGGGNVTIIPAAYAKTKAGSAGPPSMHNEIRIVGENGQDQPANETGEILVRGPAVTAGYWDAPEQTAETVVDDWLHTGDMGYLDEDGFLYVAGRKKEMIISGGMNIFPAEIEDVLRNHEAVNDVAVIGLPDERWGERVCAVVESKPGGPPVVEEELIEFCREHLASYKKPTRVIEVEALPRTASGKAQKFVLVEQFGEVESAPAEAPGG